MKERVEAEEKSAIVGMEKVLVLEAELAELMEENKVLDGLEDELKGLNVDLTKHEDLLLKTYEEIAQSNEVLTKERDELRMEVEKLRLHQADNIKIIESLRATIEKDAKIIVEQTKGMILMGTELEEKTKYIDGAKVALKAKFAELYEEYKASLLLFDAEPVPYPGDKSIVEIFE